MKTRFVKNIIDTAFRKEVFHNLTRPEAEEIIRKKFDGIHVTGWRYKHSPLVHHLRYLSNNENKNS